MCWPLYVIKKQLMTIGSWKWKECNIQFPTVTLECGPRGQVPWIDHPHDFLQLLHFLTFAYHCLDNFLLQCWYDDSHWLQLFWSGGRYKAGRNREANQGISLIPCKTCVMIWSCWCVCSVQLYLKKYMKTCQPILWLMYLFHLICLWEYDRMFVEQVIIK
jgi:hypothetical protein